MILSPAVSRGPLHRILRSSLPDIRLAFEATLLCQVFATGLSKKYPMFYANIPKLYSTHYGDAQFLTMLAGCGILAEVLRGTLSLVPRANVVTNTIYICVIFICGGLAASYLSARGDMHEPHNIVLERHFRLAQSLLLLILAGAVFHYRVPVGKNLKGMFVGYGPYIAVSLATLTLLDYREPTLSPVLAMIQPISYVAALLIWTIALWRYRPNPVGQPGPVWGVALKAVRPQSTSLGKEIRFRVPKVAGF